MKASLNTSYNSGRKITSALVFALAVLLLVVSCPLKRFLQLNTGSSISFRKGTSLQTATSTNYQAASCCSIKKKIVLVEASKSKQAKPTAHVFVIHTEQSGFEIHDYLSRTDVNLHLTLPARLSPLPLFLQHRRLLI